MNGEGTLYYRNGKKAYEGMWQDDRFCGKGTVFNENPIRVKGKFNYADFDQLGDFWIKYDGHFKDDCKHGIGTIYLSNDDWFTGTFEKDVVQGRGTYFQRDGHIISGEWSNNKLIKMF